MSVSVSPSLGIQDEVIRTPNQREALAKIEAYPFAQVSERLREKNLVSEDDLDEAIFEMKRFFALILLGFKGLAMASSVVGEVWDAFILFYSDYRIFFDDI